MEVVESGLRLLNQMAAVVAWSPLAIGMQGGLDVGEDEDGLG